MLEEQTIFHTSDLPLHRKISLFEQQLNIDLTIHDIRGIWSLDFRDYLMPGRRWHRCAYCWDGRFEHPDWALNCTRDCMHLPHKRCRTDAAPFWKKCWKGVWELVVPIVRNGQTMLILYAGTFRDAGSALPEAVRALPEHHQKLYKALQSKSSVNEDILVNALELFGTALLSEWERSGNEEHQPGVSGNMQEIITGFIVQRAAQPITLEDLAKYLSLSKSRTGHAVKEHLGKSFGTLLREERMNRAVNLLSTHPQITIAELALSVGYNDPAYFMRLFTRTFGMPPRSYQKKISDK